MVKDENGETMSKSKGNVIAPEDMIEKYGSDAVRAYILFMAPPDKDLIWSYEGLEGMWKFLNRVWRLVHILMGDTDDSIPSSSASDLNNEALANAHRELQREMHRVIGKVTGDMERFGFNTGISAIMELVNTTFQYLKISAEKQDAELCAEVAKTIVLLLSPIVPHFGEELWHGALGQTGSINDQPWPAYDAKLAKADEVEIVIQINGKKKARANVSPEASEDDVMTIANELVADQLTGKDIKKVIYVPGKLLNIVAK